VRPGPNRDGSAIPLTPGYDVHPGPMRVPERYGETRPAPLVRHLRRVMFRQVAPELVSVQQPQTTALERLCFLGHPFDPELLEVQVAGEPPPETRDDCPGARRRVSR
jgi:hypothetical protein